jgi:hypothetical protein
MRGEADMQWQKMKKKSKYVVPTDKEYRCT